MKPAKKFVLGAVYAVQWGDDEWRPAMCVGDNVGAFVRLAWLDTKAMDYNVAFHPPRGAYRIRARDWEGGKWGSLGAPELEPDPAAFFAFFGIDRSVSGVRLSGLYEKIYGGLVTPFVYGPTCTCGIGAAPSRKHWASCPVKQEAER